MYFKCVLFLCFSASILAIDYALPTTTENLNTLQSLSPINSPAINVEISIDKIANKHTESITSTTTSQIQTSESMEKTTNSSSFWLIDSRTGNPISVVNGTIVLPIMSDSATLIPPVADAPSSIVTSTSTPTVKTVFITVTVTPGDSNSISVINAPTTTINPVIISNTANRTLLFVESVLKNRNQESTTQNTEDQTNTVSVSRIVISTIGTTLLLAFLISIRTAIVFPYAFSLLPWANQMPKIIVDLTIYLMHWIILILNLAVVLPYYISFVFLWKNHQAKTVKVDQSSFVNVSPVIPIIITLSSKFFSNQSINLFRVGNRRSVSSLEASPDELLRSLNSIIQSKTTCYKTARIHIFVTIGTRNDEYGMKKRRDLLFRIDTFIIKPLMSATNQNTTNIRKPMFDDLTAVLNSTFDVDENFCKPPSSGNQKLVSWKEAHLIDVVFDGVRISFFQCSFESERIARAQSYAHVSSLYFSEDIDPLVVFLDPKITLNPSSLPDIVRFMENKKQVQIATG
ncbi:hypothetical protein HK096_003385, partial [Nowakowskiella sp. JEL0078]